MKIFIGREFNNGRCFLTTDSSTSSYGIPALRILPGIPGVMTPESDLGPGDFIRHVDGHYFVVGAIVKSSVEMNLKKYSKIEIAVVKNFLSQWPEGPQLEVKL